jgi:hypothetical protein
MKRAGSKRTYNGERDEVAGDGEGADLTLVASLITTPHLPGGERVASRSSFMLCSWDWVRFPSAFQYTLEGKMFVPEAQKSPALILNMRVLQIINLLKLPSPFELITSLRYCFFGYTVHPLPHPSSDHLTV